MYDGYAVVNVALLSVADCCAKHLMMMKSVPVFVLSSFAHFSSLNDFPGANIVNTYESFIIHFHLHFNSFKF